MNHVTKSEREAIYKKAEELAIHGDSQKDIETLLEVEFNISHYRAHHAAAHALHSARLRRRLVSAADLS